MVDVVTLVVACLPCVCLLFAATFQMIGAMQQGGYECGNFLRWLKRKDNLYFNRLFVWSGLSVCSTAVVAACFLPLGVKTARLLTALPFFACCLTFVLAGRKYALKVPVKRTSRLLRISALYILIVACALYVLLAFLNFFDGLIPYGFYSAFAFLPVSLLPLALPFLLCAAAWLEGFYARRRNGKYIKRAGQVLNETPENKDMIRVGIVGSYGKTSVKNILSSILSVKYDVIATPKSYNTPMGVARTVLEEGVTGKQVFIAEMGARKKGDIAELCSFVAPNYAILTGVCAQHIASFGSEEEVLEAKCEVLQGAEKVVASGELRDKMISAGLLTGNCQFVDFSSAIKNLELKADKTQFTLVLGEEEIFVSTKLLGAHSAENIAIAAALAKEMGLTAEEIAKGLDGIQFVPHRLELSESGGVYILDDGYNTNERGAKAALEALGRFAGKKLVVTPGIVECGVLEEKINGELGKAIAEANLDGVILVGETLVGAVKDGYLAAGGDKEKLSVVSTLDGAKELLQGVLGQGDCVLFLNDLPDVY